MVSHVIAGQLSILQPVLSSNVQSIAVAVLTIMSYSINSKTLSFVQTLYATQV